MELKNYMAKMGLHQQILVSYRNNTRRIRCRENAKRDNAIYRRPYEFTAGFSIGGYFGISMVRLLLKLSLSLESVLIVCRPHRYEGLRPATTNGGFPRSLLGTWMSAIARPRIICLWALYYFLACYEVLTSAICIYGFGLLVLG